MTGNHDSLISIQNVSANINFALLRAVNEDNPNNSYDILVNALLELPIEVTEEEIYSALIRIGFNQLVSLQRNENPTFRQNWITSLNLIIKFVEANATHEFKSDQRYINLMAQVKKLNMPVIPR